MAEQKGKCKHGEFDLDKGCPQCITEFKKAGLITTVPQTELSIVKVNPETDAQVMAFYDQALGLQKWAEELGITTIEYMKTVNNDLIIIRRLKKAMEEKRKSYLQPFQDHIKETDNAFKKLMAPLEIADKITSDKMLAFNAEQARIRREQEEINQLRMEAAQKDAALHNGEISEPVNLVEVIPQAPKRIQTEVGSTRMRDNWTWELVDIKLVPAEYLMVNAGVLTPIVKASKGRVAIPGIRQYNEPILAIGR